MGRLEFPSCLYRDRDGTIHETPFPDFEPDPYDVEFDLYCLSYEMKKGLFGPAKVDRLEITIFNTRSYKKDPDLEREAKARLLDAMQRKEGPEVVAPSGGLNILGEQISVDTFWLEPSDPRARPRK